jgi:hypothetical protein
VKILIALPTGDRTEFGFQRGIDIDDIAIGIDYVNTVFHRVEDAPIKLDVAAAAVVGGGVGMGLVGGLIHFIFFESMD